MKKILIISYLFAPNNAIGAIRPTKIAKYLTKQGHLVDVVTSGIMNDGSFNEELNINKIYYLNKNVTSPTSSITSKSNDSKKQKKDTKFIIALKSLYRYFLQAPQMKLFKKKFIELFECTLKLNNYDAVITSYGPICSIKCGLYLKKTHPGIKWICEFRDPLVTEITSSFLRPYFSYMQNRACKKADAIIAVSKGYLTRICKGKYKNKAYMIPNGYDKSDFILSETLGDSFEILSFTYVGALYEGKRNLSPLFHALRELIDQNIIDINKIAFNYAGGEFSFLSAQAEKYNMGNIIINHGCLSRQECLKLQFSSHFLILSTWNNKGEEGVFPGKFLEYMLVKKPIISIVDGNLSESEVSQVIKEAHLGISYEAANSSEDYKKLKEYLKSQYFDFKNNKLIVFEPNENVISRYDYENVIKKIERLL